MPHLSSTEATDLIVAYAPYFVSGRCVFIGGLGEAEAALMHRYLVGEEFTQKELSVLRVSVDIEHFHEEGYFSMDFSDGEPFIELVVWK